MNGSILKQPEGWRIRHFGGKTNHNRWSSYVFVPRLRKQYKNICVVYAMELIVRKTASMNLVLMDLPGFPKQRPFFMKMVGIPQGKGEPCLFTALSTNSVANKFRDYFLAVVEDTDAGDGTMLSGSFSQHTVRHAVASLLADMEVPAASVAAHLHVTEHTLRANYTVPTRSTWEIPRKCVQRHESLAAKLLVPFVHWHSTSKGRKCACASFCVDQK